MTWTCISMTTMVATWMTMTTKVTTKLTDEGFAGLSNGGDDSGDDGDHGGEVEEENHVESNSELTDIGSTSDAVKVVSAPKKKRVQRGRGY